MTRRISVHPNTALAGTILVRVWLNGCGHAADTTRMLHTADTGVAQDAITTYIRWWSKSLQA